MRWAAAWSFSSCGSSRLPWYPKIHFEARRTIRLGGLHPPCCSHASVVMLGRIAQPSLRSSEADQIAIESVGRLERATQAQFAFLAIGQGRAGAGDGVLERFHEGGDVGQRFLVVAGAG